MKQHADTPNANHGMSHQECRDSWDLLPRIPNRPFDIFELLLPTRLPIRAILTLVLRIQRRLSEPTGVVSEHSDAFLRVLVVHVVVSTNVFGKAVKENENCLRLVGFVYPGVELCPTGASKPALFKRGGHDEHRDSAQGVGVERSCRSPDQRHLWEKALARVTLEADGKLELSCLVARHG